MTHLIPIKYRAYFYLHTIAKTLHIYNNVENMKHHRVKETRASSPVFSVIHKHDVESSLSKHTQADIYMQHIQTFLS